MYDIILLFSSLFSVLAMGTYFFNVKKGVATPNPATWLIWLFIGVINLMTYFVITKDGHMLKVLPLVCVVFGIFSVTVYSLLNGKFSPLKGFDKICLFSALLIGVFWQISGNAVISNLVLQVIYAISFGPTILGLYKREISESYKPWALAVVSYLLMTFVIVSTWSSSSWVELVHPLVNGLLGNGIILYLCLINKVNRKTKVAFG